MDCVPLIVVAFVPHYSWSASAHWSCTEHSPHPEHLASERYGQHKTNTEETNPVGRLGLSEVSWVELPQLRRILPGLRSMLLTFTVDAVHTTGVGGTPAAIPLDGAGTL